MVPPIPTLAVAAFGLLSNIQREQQQSRSFLTRHSSMSQKWSPSDYVEHASFVADLGLPVVQWLDPKPNESILDLGCGDGALTVKLQKDYGCSVVGVDASKEMIQAAKRDYDLDARVINGHELSFAQEFDAVFSNAALHWMKQGPERVVQGVHNSLKPGGRFVAEFGGVGNIATIETAIRRELNHHNLHVSESPWYFPSPQEYQELLEKNGFQVERIELIPRPTPLSGDASGWLKTFANPYFEAVPDENIPKLIQSIVKTLEPQLVDENGIWLADYVRLRFRATKPH